jgi:hypothetical protein
MFQTSCFIFIFVIIFGPIAEVEAQHIIIRCSLLTSIICQFAPCVFFTECDGKSSPSPPPTHSLPFPQLFLAATVATPFVQVTSNSQ